METLIIVNQCQKQNLNKIYHLSSPLRTTKRGLLMINLAWLTAAIEKSVMGPCQGNFKRSKIVATMTYIQLT